MVYPLLPAFVTGHPGRRRGGARAARRRRRPDLGGAQGGERPAGRPAAAGGARSSWSATRTAVLVRPLIAVAGAAWQVVGFRVVDRVGKGLRTPPRDALIAGGHAAGARAAAPSASIAGADHFGAVLGSLAAWYLLSRGVRGPAGHRVERGAGRRRLRCAGGRASRDARCADAPRVPAAETADPGGRVFWAPVLALTAPHLLPAARGAAPPAAAGRGGGRSRWCRWSGPGSTSSGARSSYPGRLAVRSPRPARHRRGGRPALCRGGRGARRRRSRRPRAVVAFLALGLVAGLTESAERAMVARLAPVRTGRGFGLYHALTGAGRTCRRDCCSAALPDAGRPGGPGPQRGSDDRRESLAWLAVSPRITAPPERSIA